MTAAVVPTPVGPNQRDASGYAHLLPLLRRMAGLSAGDPVRAALRNDVVLALLPVVRNIAARHCAVPAAREELVQVGTVGLITAIDRWDPELSPDDVLGYVVPCVRGEILRHFRDRTWAVRVSRRLKDLTVSINHALGPLAQSLGRPPRPSELAERIGVGVAEVLEALEAQDSRHAASLDALLDPETGAGDRFGGPDPALARIEDAHALGPLLEALPEREREILLLRFFGNRTQTQIASQMGISQMHVSRLLSRTLRELRGALLGEGLAAGGT
ncbi:sigma-70 family RNA polymerase sigma factor [Pseudonocardia lacus]|uniref:sigma-70 family RNA polymerase sigma factor n=1 Tax=Pseudonocardia lacus TaxID=2835865 RepID=UPI0027E228AA|nr:sigma-70 family RNA polymerase sigma factor [Pseudonocardia lacus]